MARREYEPYTGLVVRHERNTDRMSSKLDFSKELNGRRALVTGGTRGIGAGIAKRLLDAGAQVVVTARSRGETLPSGVVFVAGDVTSLAGVKAVAADALSALGGGIDILVNNAGVPPAIRRAAALSPTRSGRRPSTSTCSLRFVSPTRCCQRSDSPPRATW
jgi:NAD(P)-dependent dehydrogenase (short-subunit alcohol dehydrogenase family)